MKKLIIVLIVMFVGLSINTQAQTVYVTKSGTKYHTKDCQHSKGATQMSLADAKAKKLTACNVCSATDKTKKGDDKGKKKEDVKKNDDKKKDDKKKEEKKKDGEKKKEDKKKEEDKNKKEKGKTKEKS